MELGQKLTEIAPRELSTIQTLATKAKAEMNQVKA
jgi:hypothetical protein